MPVLELAESIRWPGRFRLPIPGCWAWFALVTSGCAVTTVPGPIAQPAQCPAGARPMTRETLYMGRGIPGGGVVSDSAWDDFLATVVVPAFPDGFTVLDGRGQWRSPQGEIVSEPTRILIVLRDPQAAESTVTAVAAGYRIRFHQDAVLRETTTACVRF